MPTKAATGDAKAYSGLAIVLHWLIGALILTEIGIGWTMNHIMADHTPAQEQVQDLHVTIGLATLILIAVRIVVALAQHAPPLPAGIPGWEAIAAKLSKLVFYVLMVGFVVTGWMMISARHEHASLLGLTWPELPGMDMFNGPTHRDARRALNDLHRVIFMWTMLGVLALHVAGAIKHQFDGHPVLWRMLPFLKPKA